ncbi:MAG TPA: ABC transporter permease [Stellaceae bacterium]|nr:ABC transporter permease [Stellaceae bacterium]
MTVAVLRAPTGRRVRRSLIPLGRIALGVAFLAMWQFGSNVMGATWLPGPVDTLERIWQLTVSGELARDTLITLGEATAGMAIGGAAGAALPFLLRLSPRLMTTLDPLISAAFGLPKLALAPLFILWFGIGVTTKVVFVASIVFFLMFYNGLAGIFSIDPRLVAMLRVAGASQWAVTREIVWNTTKPFLFSGLKIALPRALSGAVVGEFIAADSGLGWYIQNARSLNDTTGVVAGAVIVTVLVIGVNAALKRVQARSLAWRPVSRDMTI